MYERELVLDSVIYLEPVENSIMGSKVMKFKNFCDSTSGRVEDKFKSISWSGSQLE